MFECPHTFDHLVHLTVEAYGSPAGLQRPRSPWSQGSPRALYHMAVTINIYCMRQGFQSKFLHFEDFKLHNKIAIMKPLYISFLIYKYIVPDLHYICNI